MSVIPCQQNADLKTKIVQFAEVLKTQSHQLGDHGLSENEFYNSGLFRGAVERIRGQFSATMSEKREFVRYVLNHVFRVARGVATSVPTYRHTPMNDGFLQI